MAPSAKVKAAFQAMRDIGISETKTKPVLKKLYKLFDKNWDAIEQENYRVLADAIFEYEENESAQNAEKEKKKPENGQRGEGSEAPTWQDGPMQEENMEDEPERPLKRLRLKHQGQGASSNGQSSLTDAGALKIPKPEPGEPDASLTTAPPLVRNKGKQPVSSSNTGASTGRVHSSASKKASQALKLKEPMATLIKPKDEPFTDDMLSIEPLAVIHPDPESPLNKAPSNSANQVGSQDCSRPTVDGVGEGMGSMTSTGKEKQLQEVDVSDRPPAKINIAASTLGNVQISLTCDPVSKGHEMYLPDLEAVMKQVNDHCLKTYKITDPDFSVAKLMKQFCDCVEELGKNANGVPETFSGHPEM